MFNPISSHRSFLAWFAIVVSLIAGCATSQKPISRQDAISRQDVCSERTVFVGELGSNQNEPRVRLLLEQRLRELGFSVVRDRQQAEIILSGTLKVENRRGGLFGERLLTLVWATVNIETTRGVVWTVDAIPQRGVHGDHLAIRAGEVADSVLQACNQRWTKDK